MQPTNKARYEALRKLPPLEAVQAWLDYSFGIGDEPAMCEAIRKDAEITLSDDEISDIVMDAMDEESTAEQCLKKMKAAGKS